MIILSWLKKAWRWVGEDINNNVLMFIVAVIAVAVGLHTVYNIQVTVSSIQQDIENLYQRYALETFCYNELKDSYKTVDSQNVVDIRLKNNPIPNSINVWEGAVSVAPSGFKVEGDIVEVQTNSSPAILKALCNNGSGFNFTVTYVRDF